MQAEGLKVPLGRGTNVYMADFMAGEDSVWELWNRRGSSAISKEISIMVSKTAEQPLGQNTDTQRGFLSLLCPALERPGPFEASSMR